MCPIDVVVSIPQGYLGKNASAGLNFVDFVKPSCPWIHGRLNINRSTFALSHPPTSVTLSNHTNILKPKEFLLNKNPISLGWSAS